MVEGIVAGEEAGVLWNDGLVAGHPFVVERVGRMVREGQVIAVLHGVDVVASVSPASSRVVVAATLMAAFDEVDLVVRRPRPDKS